MTHLDEYWASLTLKHCPQLGLRQIKKLLIHFGSALSALENLDEWRNLKIAGFILDEIKRKTWEEATKKEFEKSRHYKVLLWNDPEYPTRLKEISDPPVFLYYAGELDLLLTPSIAIVGSRSPCERNLNVAYSLAKSLSDCGITIVSGMAKGIDRYAHKGSLNSIGKSIGILGTGIDICYPNSNRDLFKQMEENGLLVSEFAPETPPLGKNFPIRNRIISGLSFGVVVVEAAAYSGSLLTARFALEQNREVFAVPGQALDNNSLGCQNLVRDGAHPVFTADDILQNLEAVLKPYANIVKPVERMSPKKDQLFNSHPAEVMPGTYIDDNKINEKFDKELENEIIGNMDSNNQPQKVLNCLKISGPLQIDVLSEKIPMDMKELNSLLILMEMTGEVSRLPGARYKANI